MARPEDGYSDRPNDREDDRFRDPPRRGARGERREDEFDYEPRSRFRREDVPNHLGMAIMVTLLCCTVGGVVSVVYAAQANSKAEKGDYDGAMQAANTARTWMWVSFAIGLIAQPLLIWLQLGPSSAGSDRGERVVALSLKIRRRILLAIALVLPLLAVVLYRFPPAEHSWYPRCVLYSTTRLHCPGCGATRCLHALAHGDLVQALAYNALIVLTLPLIVVWLIRHVWAAVRGHDSPPSRLSPRVGMALAGLFIVYGVMRNVPVYPLTLLAPHSVRSEQADPVPAMPPGEG